MSSSEDNGDEDISCSLGHAEERFSKKRKGRACDVCRRRKVKCDGAETTDRSCTNCTISRTRCTYAEPSKRRFNVPPEYVEDLKARVQKLESVLSELFPCANVKARDLNPESLRQSLLIPGPDNGIKEKDNGSETQKSSSSINSVDVVTGVEEEEVPFVHSNRFQGRSSASALLSDALKLTMPSDVGGNLTFQSIMSRHQARGHAYYLECALDLFFQGPIPQFNLPAEDLMDSLVQLFFDRVHWIFPILHIPTFYSQYRAKLYTRSSNFATILLLVCAAGSRYSTDTRVLPTCLELQNEPESEKWHHAGLDYYAQVFPHLGRPPTHSPTLFDLQKLALACQYLQESKNYTQAWALSGLGIRIAVEVGAHRKKSDTTLTVESQLWSRVFWTLVAIDRLVSATTGRPCAIQDEDIDAEYPLGVDDEHWEKPDLTAWKQPFDKPALADCSRSCIGLLEILAFTLRAVYSTPKSRTMQGLVGPDWQQRVVLEIDSALNKWFDSIPEHLRWDPLQENKILLNQSALLNCLYYHVQMLAHRPFISLKSSSLSFASLAICTNAARSSSHILEVHLAKGEPLSCLTNCAFSSGIVLLLNIWGAKKLGVRADPERHMQDVFKCMSWLKAHGKRWTKAEITWDVLNELLSAGKLPRPQSESSSDLPVGTKRSRQSTIESEVDSEATLTSPGQTDTSSQSDDHNQTVQDLPSSITGQHPGGGLEYFSGSQLSIVPDQWQRSDSTVVPTGQHDSINCLGYHSEPTHVDFTEKASVQVAGAASDPALLFADSIGTISESHIDPNSSFLFPDPELQSALAGPPYAQGQADNIATQSYTANPEGFPGLDMLDIWTTAPASFEAQDWEDFAQEYQIEEQLRLSGIFADP